MRRLRLRMSQTNSMSTLNQEGGEERYTLVSDAPPPAAVDADGHEEEPSNAGIVGTALNMACNIMGGAVLVLPTAVQNASLVFGAILILGIGLMSCTTMIMLIHSSEKLQKYDYRGLLSKATVPLAGRLFEICLFFYTYGVLVEYGRVIIDSMPDVARDFFKVESGILTEGWFWLLLACIPFIGLTSLPRLTELKWSSIIGFGTIAYVQILIVVRFFDGSYKDGREDLNASDVDVYQPSMNFFRAIPVLAVAFSCHYNVPVYYKELKVRTLSQFYRVLLVVHPALITAYLLCGVLGYLTFGDAKLKKTTGNIVNAYNTGDVPANVGRLGLFFHFCSAFPIVALGCRRCLNGIIFQTYTRPQYVYCIEAVILVSTSALLAYLVPGIDFVVSVIGSLFGVAIVFIIPAVVYIGAFRKESSSSTEAEKREAIAAASDNAGLYGTGEDGGLLTAPKCVVKKSPWLYYLAFCFVPLGIAGAIISFTMTIINIAS